MIVVRRSERGFTVDGHARYATHGQDIVCAAVSTLVSAFYLSARELTSDEIKADFKPGKAVIGYKNLSDKGNLLLDSLFCGLRMVANEFPDYVRVE